MPDPSSFMVGNAPQGASYAAPFVGFQIGDRLAALPEEYYKAQLRAPVIDPRTGQPTNDPQLVLKALAERGGLQATLSSGLMPFILGQSSGDELDRALGGGGSGPNQASSPAPAVTPPLRPAAFPATGPSHITGEFKQPQSSAPSPSNETPSAPPAPSGAGSGSDRASFAEVERLRSEGLLIQRAAERAAAYPQWKERAQVGLAAAQAKLKQADEMEAFLREGPRARAKAAAEWPYAITRTMAERGSTPISVKENEVTTTGSQINPLIGQMGDEAARQMGFTPFARPGMPQAAPQAPQGAAQPTPPPGAPAIPGAGAPPSGNPFTPRLIPTPGGVTSSVTPGLLEMQKGAGEAYEDARKKYEGAQDVKRQVAIMENNFRELNSANWSTAGTGAEARLNMAKAANSIFSALGVKGEKLPFDPDKVASWESLTKESLRLGFALSRSLGAREAMQVVQSAIKANPGIQNTPLGARMVMNAIRESAQRDTDYYRFATQYGTQRGHLVGADIAFNKVNPPELYGRRAIVQARKDIPSEAIEALRADPSKAAAFDAHYNGRGLSKMFLGNVE
jgi:hypothetical protein